MAVVVFSCNTSTQNQQIENAEEHSDSALANDTTLKVIGVGGVFFYSQDPEKTNDWYAKNLGFEVNDWGSVSFETRNRHNPEQINAIQWKAFKDGDQYFAPSAKPFMMNYQVQNIEGMVEKLRGNGVTIVDSIETFDYGKFVHILDGDGNKIELWEPT